MERCIFIKKLKEVIKKAQDVSGAYFGNIIVSEDPDFDSDYGADEQGYLIVNRCKTMLNISDLEGIKYRAIENAFDINRSTEMICELEDCYISFLFKKKVALYIYFGLGELGQEVEFIYKGKRFAYDTSFRIITAINHGWNGEDDFVITSDGCMIGYLGDEKKLVIPEGVEEIGNAAFEGSDVVSIVLADTTKKIGSRAFLSTKMMESIDLKGVESIGKDAFRGSNLKNILLPKSLREIGKGAFSYSQVTSINDITNESDVEITEEIFRN
ncbi:MAG: leucine-rich repeat domain-containing protein [Lachnospiraceae bacterium]|nr:leucine-rich repeat domain-containing protein [Lachnospiraceae bacterium]